MIKFSMLLLSLFFLAVAPCRAEPLPQPVADMIENAVKSGNKATIKAVVDIAKKSNPNSVAEIDDLLGKSKKAAKERRIAKLKTQSFYEGWSGEGQMGMSTSSGNSSNTSVALGVKVSKESLHWRHKFAAAADYQKSDGVKTANKYQASYEANYKFSERFFTFGLLQWEKDRFAGYTNRFTESPGFGYVLVKTPNINWQLSGGPAFRQTKLITGQSENQTSARASTDFSWTVFNNVTLTENASAYMDGGNNTYLSVTAVTGKINGALSARASYEVKYESAPPDALHKTDTISRFTLVYGF